MNCVRTPEGSCDKPQLYKVFAVRFSSSRTKCSRFEKDLEGFLELLISWYLKFSKGV